MRQLAPFILLSLSLHLAILLFLPFSQRVSGFVQTTPLQVKLVTAYNEFKPVILPAPQIGKKHKILPLPALPQITSGENTSAQQILESARLISRETAVQGERAWDANNKKRLNTPLTNLEEYLKQPHKEIHLANGMLKIVTSFGEYCFLPVPYFAQQTPGLYGVTSSCP